MSDYYKEIIEDELNVKEVVFSDDVRDYTTYKFKPQLKTVGPKYGKMLGGIKKALEEVDGNAAMDTLNSKGTLEFDIDGQKVELSREDLLIEQSSQEGYVSSADGGVTVVLDTNLTDELIEEGFVREIISKIQTMRKEADFEVMDKIIVSVCDNEKIKEVINANLNKITSEVLAESIVFDVNDLANAYEKEWNINGEKVKLAVSRNA